MSCGLLHGRTGRTIAAVGLALGKKVGCRRSGSLFQLLAGITSGLGRVCMTFISGLENFVEQDTALAERTWFKLGGVAEYFAQPPSQDALMSLVTRCREEELPMRILGGGPTYSYAIRV